MNLPSCRDLKLDATTRALLGDVEDTARRVNDLRPLEPATVKSVVDGLMADRVYSSNAVEGNPLGLGETREILKAGHVEAGKRREVDEVLNLRNAIDHVAEQLQGAKNPYQLDDLLRLHRVLMLGMDDKKPGLIRTVSVMIGGARQQPPDAADVATLLREMMIRLRTETDVHPVVRATWGHWAVARIHPFLDGNGRLARLWQDLILFREQYTCAIIPPHLRNQYLHALAAADEGNFNELIQQTARLVAETFDRYLMAQQNSETMRAWATALVGPTETGSFESQTLSYLRWCRKMEELRLAFAECSARITQAHGGVEIQIQLSDIIVNYTWENLRCGVSVSHPWFFQLCFRRKESLAKYNFYFGRHIWTGHDTPTDREVPRVGLFFNEQPQDDDKSGQTGCEDPNAELTLRELFESEQKIVRKRFDPTTNAEVYDRDVSTITIAQDFISEVLSKRLP